MALKDVEWNKKGARTGFLCLGLLLLGAGVFISSFIKIDVSLLRLLGMLFGFFIMVITGWLTFEVDRMWGRIEHLEKEKRITDIINYGG